MYHLLLLLYFLLTTISTFSDQEGMEELFLSTPDQIATLASDSDLLIGGLVNPLSGQLVLRPTDLIVKGAQKIALSRVYIPPHMPCSFPKKEKQRTS